MCLQDGTQHSINTDDNMVEKALPVRVVGVSIHNGIHVIQRLNGQMAAHPSQRVGPPDKAFYLNPGISFFVLLWVVFLCLNSLCPGPRAR